MHPVSRLYQRLTGRAPARRTPAHKPARCFRPQLEILERRTLLSTFAAATAADLVADIQAANLAGGANTIVLTAPANSPYALTSVDNTADGPTVLPQIASGNNLTILTGNGTTPPGYGDALDAGQHGRLFDVAAGGALTLQNVTLQNGLVCALGGFVTRKGGAVCNQGTLVLDHVLVANNAVVGWGGGRQDAAGGGVWSNGSLTAENTAFTGNSATGSNDIGAPANGGNAYGGALCIAGGTAAITDSSFGLLNGRGNTAKGGGTTGSYKPGSGYGGAVYIAAGVVRMSGDTVSNPPGISGSSPNLALGYNAFASGYGGGVCVAGGTVTFTNDTISYNRAGGYGPTSMLNNSQGRGGGIFIAPGATVYLDSFTVAHAVYNAGGYATIEGKYILLS